MSTYIAIAALLLYLPGVRAFFRVVEAFWQFAEGRFSQAGLR